MLAVAALAAGVIVPVAITVPAHADATVPFSCEQPTMFYSDGDPSPTGTVLFSSPQDSPAFAPVGAATPGVEYNAIGWDPVDHFIYGQTPANPNSGLPDLLRIDAAGAVTDLGPVNIPGGSVVGAFDPLGTYYSLPLTGNVIYAVDVATRVATPIPINLPARFADFTYMGGYFWAVATASNTMLRINPATQTVDQFTLPDLPVIRPGAAWTFANGDLAFNDNGVGSLGSSSVFVLRVTNPAAANPGIQVLGVFNAPPYNGVDGTACSLPSDLSITKSAPATVLPGAPISYTLTVTNNGPGDNSDFTVTDTVPNSVSGVASSTNGCSVTGQTVTCTGWSLSPGDSAVITITGTATTSQGTTITNVATVTSPVADTDTSNNTAQATTVVATINEVCRASGLRLPLNINYAVANPGLSPCHSAVTAPLNVVVPGVVKVVSAGSATVSGMLDASAASDVASATLYVLGHTIVLTGIHSQATSFLTTDCAHSALLGDSHVVMLIIDGRSRAVTSAPLTINLGVAVLHLNQQVITGNTVTERTVFLDLPGTAADVIIGESIAGAACG